MLPDSGVISMKDIGQELIFTAIPTRNPRDCTYFFETANEFELQKESILARHNYNLSQVSLGFSTRVEDLNWIFNNEIKITHSPSIIMGFFIRRIHYFFYWNLNLVDVNPNIFIYLYNLEAAENCFAQSSNIKTEIPEIWNKNKYPMMTHFKRSLHYATNCTSASNYYRIPKSYGGPMDDVDIPLMEGDVKTVSLNDKNVREIAEIPYGTISLADFYGKTLVGFYGDIYRVDTPYKAQYIWDDLYDLYGPDLGGVIVIVDDSIDTMNAGGNRNGHLITATPRAIIGKKLKNIAFLFINFTELREVAAQLFDRCPNLENVQSTFDGCVNANFVPELWNKDKFPKITYYDNYGNRCFAASNRNNIPKDWRGV